MRKLLLLVFVSLSLSANAQLNGAPEFKFNHLAISVSNLQTSAEFYNRVLGLEEIANRGKVEGVRWFSFGDGRELHLISIVKKGVTTNKAVHLALTSSSFDSFVTKLQSLKIPYSDWPGNVNKVNVRADGIKQIFFQDPDGYWIEVNSEN
ncbi:VOC family protein [Flavihumibacter sp. R14]|nr:VOC family protein [Flavihumibacter soli]